MSTKMPSTLERYFAATNQHDVEAMTAAFADEAVVKDEGQEHRGSAAIRGWMNDTIRKYHFTVEPTAAARAHDRTVVTVVVSGNFPGSPVTLDYRFKLDGQKISRLEIG
jgi:hypothetical protein